MSSKQGSAEDIILRADSNMIESDSCGEDYLGPVVDGGRGYDARPSSGSCDGYRGRCSISGLPVGADAFHSRTTVPETEPQDYGYHTSLCAPGPSGGVVGDAPVHVSPCGNMGAGAVPGGDGGHVYGSEVDRRVDFRMSEEDIDQFVGRDYPFVLRLSKIGSRVVKNIGFKTNVFLKGRSTTAFREEFELSTDMPGNLLETVKSRINFFLGDVARGTVAEELHDANNDTLFVKSLKQVDLLDIRTDIDRLPNSGTQEAGGTRQVLLPLQNSSDLVIALNLIAFRDNVRNDEYTQSTRLSAFVLDVVVKVRRMFLLSLLIFIVINKIMFLAPSYHL